LSPLAESSGFKAPGVRLHPLSSAISKAVLPREYYLEGRVGFVSIADLMTMISWLFSGFITLAYWTSASLSETNTNLYLPDNLTKRFI
jgi:hypothetical protein